jgi:hypothetical protein
MQQQQQQLVSDPTHNAHQLSSWVQGAPQHLQTNNRAPCIHVVPFLLWRLCPPVTNPSSSSRCPIPAQLNPRPPTFKRLPWA